MLSGFIASSRHDFSPAPPKNPVSAIYYVSNISNTFLTFMCLEVLTLHRL